MLHSIHELAEDIRRQVKRHREKRRKRAQTRRLVGEMRGRGTAPAASRLSEPSERPLRRPR